MQVYSNAFNFSSFLSGGVDPRTGLYGSRITLLTITPEGPSENTREIALSFSMLNQNRGVYGWGWSITSAQFDRTTDQLRTLTGEVNRISSFPNVGTILSFGDRKLQDMFVRQVDQNTLHILHKDGVMEVLQPLVANGVFVIRQLIFENGEIFEFVYDSSDRLERIDNTSAGRTLLRLQYSTANLLSSASILKDGGREARIDFTYLNEQLVTVAMQAGNSNAATFTFQYQIMGSIRAISNFTDPNGRRDVIQYRQGNAAHAFHQGQFIPNVQSVTTDASPSPGVTKSYTYSTATNFTGFPFSNFLPGQDNSYVQASNFQYWTQETTHEGNTTLEQKTYTFNRFHLEISEASNRAGSIVEQTVEYNLLINESFDRQPANLHLPREMTTTYRYASDARSETTTMETDRFGNQLLVKEPNGITKQFSYFPVGGASGCPPEPFGLFERFVREERIIPATGGGTQKVTTYTYIDLRNLGSTRGYVLQNTSTQGNVTNTYTYQEHTTAALHGRSTRSVMTLNGRSTTTTDTYSINGDVLIDQRRVVGFDNTYLSSTRSTSVINGLIMSVRNNDAVTVQFTYDFLARPLTETISPGTANAAVRQYTYAFRNGSVLSEVITTDALGERYIKRFDGLNRHVSTYRMQNNIQQLLREKTYNSLGQLIAETEIDRITLQDRRLQTRYAYDGWGQVSETTRADNSVAVSRYNPITRVRDQGLKEAMMIRSYMNNFGEAYLVEQTYSNSTLKLYARTFDGFGRCISEDDINGHIKRFSYDAFDRVVTASFAPAGSPVTRTIENVYATHTVEQFKTSIKVNQIVVGSRNYDGVGRLVSEWRGSNTAATTFSYTNNATTPSSTRSPAGIEKTFQYDTQLNAIRQVSSNNQSIASFTLNPKTGGLASAVNSEFRRDLQEDNFGRIVSDSQIFQNQTHGNTYTYSAGGRLESIQTALGDTETRTYDSAGRFSGAFLSGGQTGQNHLNVSYDSAGRISSFGTTVSGLLSHVTLSYDQFGRESERKMMRGGAAFQSIKLTYHNTNKIATRQLLNASQAPICAETFGYDALGRLTTYGCSGPQYSTDQQGRSIRSQEFTYDALDNITKCVTVFVDSTRDESIRSFGAADPTQLRQVTHTNPAQTITLSYDASGNLTSDGVKVYHFNAWNQMSSMMQGTSVLSRYGYDASGRQASIADAANNVATIHYSEDKVLGLRQDSVTARYIRNQVTLLARSISGIGTEVNLSDVADSVRTVVDARQQVRHVQYTPYGESAIDTGSGTLLERNRPALNGERYDPLARVYHLGNGRRAYSPELMIFLSPDPLSPFDAGGINAYAYCGGDPINFRDPSGYFDIPLWASWLVVALGITATAILGVSMIIGGPILLLPALVMGASIISLGLGIAATSLDTVDHITQSDHSRISYFLNIGALLFGLAAIGNGVTIAARAAIRAGRGANRGMTWSSYRPTVSYISEYRQVTMMPRAERTFRTRAEVHQSMRRGFIESIISYRSGGQARGPWRGINLGAAVLGVGLDVWGTINGFDEIFRSYPYKSATESESGSVYGVVESISSFMDEFNSQGDHLRNSAFFD